MGKNLPQKIGDEVRLSGEGSTVQYFFSDFPDTRNPHYQELYVIGWAEVSGRPYFDGETQGLLVRAHLLPNVRPNEKTLTLNGATGRWPLMFGDVSLALRFVREIGDGQFEAIGSAYLPERIYLEAESSTSLPLGRVPAHLDISRDQLSAGSGQLIPLFPVQGSHDRFYRSAPIDIVDPTNPAMAPPPLANVAGRSSTIIPVTLTGEGEETLFAKIEDDFRLHQFLTPVIPAVAEAPFSRRPGVASRSELWKDALMVTSRCHGRTVDDWTTMSRDEADLIWRVVVFHGILNADPHPPEWPWYRDMIEFAYGATSS